MTKRRSDNEFGDKSREKSLRLFMPGGAQGPGRGPRKGRGGRPTKEFYEWLGSVLYDPRVRARFEAILFESRDPELFLKALAWGATHLAKTGTPPHDPEDGEPLEFRLEVT